MIDRLDAYQFDWGTYNGQGTWQTSDTIVCTSLRQFSGNFETFDFSIEFEPNKEPQTSSGSANWQTTILFFDNQSKLVKRFDANSSFGRSNFQKITRDDETYYYVSKSSFKIQGLVKDPDDHNVISKYAVTVTITKEHIPNDIKEVVVTSLYKLHLKNGRAQAINAPDIPSSTFVKPMPMGAWRIDGLYNHGYPYIKRFPDIPYDLRPVDDIPINLMDKIRVVSMPHGVDALFPVTKMSIPLNKPEETKYTLGTSETKTIVQSTNNANSELYQKLKEIPKASSVLNSAKNNAANLITQALNGYVTLHQAPGGGCDEIIISDTPDYMTAQNVWRWNLGGLGFSNKGYKPEDTSAWKNAITMDGQIVADMITTGAMHADRISGGTLTLGGYDNKNGILHVIRGENEEDKYEVVRLDKDGAFVKGQIFGESPDTVTEDGDETEKRYYIRIKEGEIIGGITPDTGKEEDDTVYGKIDARAEINEYSGGTFKETRKGWCLRSKAFQIGDSNKGGELRCENFSINEYQGTSCKVEYVTKVTPHTQTVTLENGDKITVVTDVSVETNNLSFWYGILNTDTGKKPDEPERPWETK